MTNAVRRFHVPGGWPLGSALTAVFLGAVDLTVISTLLPRIVVDLNVNTADIDRYIWVVNAYLLAYIVAIPLVGRVSDVVGRGMAFQIALAVFLVGSVWSALASDLTQLIIGRAIQGAGGGALLPVTMALVGDLLPVGRRTAALGIVGAVDTLGWVLGPVWGAIIIAVVGSDNESWRWAFWINIPFGIAVSIIVARRVGFRRAPISDQTTGRIDYLGAMLLGVGLLLLNLGLSSGGEAGVTSGSAFRALGGTSNPLADWLPFLLSGGVAVLIVFVWWERRVASPLLPLPLFKLPAFTAALSANFLTGAALIVAMVDVPIVVALLATESRISYVSALLFAPFTLLMAATSLAGGFLADRFGVQRTAVTGVIMVVAGYVGIWAGLRDEAYGWMVPGLALAGAGFGLAVAPIGASAIDAVEAGDRGIAAASTMLFRLLGMTLSISALTAFGIHRLQSLSSKTEPIVRLPDESTASFFVRQSIFIQEVAIPLSVTVVRETFLLAAIIAAIAIVPISRMRNQPQTERVSASSAALHEAV